MGLIPVRMRPSEPDHIRVDVINDGPFNREKTENRHRQKADNDPALISVNAQTVVFCVRNKMSNTFKFVDIIAVGNELHP